MSGMQKGIVCLCGLALAGSFFGGMLAVREEAPAKEMRREPELFSFIRPMPATSGMEARPEVTPIVSAPAAERAGSLRPLYDHVLMLHGDRPAHDLRNEIDLVLRQHMRPEAIVHAQAGFDKYVRFREQTSEMQQRIDTAQNAADLKAVLQTLQQLRVRMFSDVERADLFPADEAYERLLVARMEVLDKTGLSDEQRGQQLQELEAQISPAVRLTEELRSNIVRLGTQPLMPMPVDGEGDVHRLVAAPGR